MRQEGKYPTDNMGGFGGSLHKIPVCYPTAWKSTHWASLPSSPVTPRDLEFSRLLSVPQQWRLPGGVRTGLSQSVLHLTALGCTH